MNTTLLKRFATEARKILLQSVGHRLEGMGFDLQTGKAAEMPQRLGGGAVFMGNVVSTGFYDRWMSLYRNIERRGIRDVAEEAAYTWFNRLVAIRILSKQGFISPVLQYESEDVHVPLIVSEARHGRMPEMSQNVRKELEGLLNDDSKTNEQFALLIVAFCHSNPIINRCFGNITDYTELLLPQDILREDGFVDMLNNTPFISDEDYGSSELIGWLYQFYISDRKDEVFAKKGKYDADEIAPATQIFTPEWIVQYMVQNTLGRIYLDNNPYAVDDFKPKWKYLVDQEQRDDEHICNIDNLEDIRCADLGCGSGHIVGYMFEVLFELYLYEGYSRRDAVEHILKGNLTGVDIDTRAKQLATFALLLKACQKDKSFADAKVMPNILDMPEPFTDDKGNEDNVIRNRFSNFILGSDTTVLNEIVDAVKLMDNAKTLGSIMKFNISERTRNILKVRLEDYEQQEVIPENIQHMIPYVKVILALTENYTALVMNPPYMGSGRFDSVLSKYVKDNYADGKADLFSVFMLMSRQRLVPNGKYSMINMQSWMFLSSFEQLRKDLLDTMQIDSMLHLGPHTFDELSGEVVQNTAFVVGGPAFLPDNNGNAVRQECRTSCPQFLNKKEYVSIAWGKLPHWHQEGKMQFVTFRLADSLPQSKIEELKTFKQEWLKKNSLPWSKPVQDEYDHQVRVKCDKWIDAGYGSCILKRVDTRKIVEDALRYYDGKEYDIHCYVIMPNHVHVLLSPIGDTVITDIMAKVKGYSAYLINKALGTKGTVWQKSVFDRMVRDADNYEQYIEYIRNNPRHLVKGDYTLGGPAFLPGNDTSDYGVVDGDGVRQECRISYSGTYYRLVEGKNCAEKERLFLTHINSNDSDGRKIYYPNVKQSDFEKIPGLVIGYWISKNMILALMGEAVSDFGISDGQNITGDNNKYLRLLWEVNHRNSGKGSKWVPIAKGGSFRRWYGNIDNVINWSPKAREEYRNNPVARIQEEYLWFRVGITWNLISSGGNTGFRLLTNDTLFNKAAPTIVMKVDSLDKTNYILGFLNSIVTRRLLNLINPTFNTNIAEVFSLGLKFSNENNISDVVSQNISISKLDWDSHETSWDFSENPLVEIMDAVSNGKDCIDGAIEAESQSDNADISLRDDRHAIAERPSRNSVTTVTQFSGDRHASLQQPCNDITKPLYDDYNAAVISLQSFCNPADSVTNHGSTLALVVKAFEKLWTARFMQLHANEEELNRQFIDIYGLQDELAPDVPLDEITILQQGEITIKDDKIVWNEDTLIKQLISYAVGVCMGRYRLDKPGLHIAYPNPSDDDLKPYQYNGKEITIDDDGIIPLMPRSCPFTDNMLKRLYDFIETVFGADNFNDNLNYMEKALGMTLEQYLIKDYWKDHKKMYQNRPIYWLFSSKKGAFQCIAYMHRMDAWTAERVRTKYLLPYIEYLVGKQNDMQANAANLTSVERRELDKITKQIAECREYHDRLHEVADKEIAFDLDDGVVVNYAKFGDVLAKIK